MGGEKVLDRKRCSSIIGGMQAEHTPVMLNECLSLLAPLDGQTKMVDSTLGEGGHTLAFLQKYPQLNITGIDRDKAQIERAKERLKAYESRLTYRNMWFDDYYMEEKKAGRKVDLILFDLGISMFHYTMSGRGFSFQKDEVLDMRLDTSEGKTARDLLAYSSEEELASIIYEYGGERFSRRIARAIVSSRRKAKITSSSVLADIIYNGVPSKERHRAIHPATKTFMALRIAVNGELDRLKRAIDLAFDCLNAGGKMAVISFHSLESGIVKRFMRSKAFPSEGERSAILLTRKGIVASEEEVERNPPSRSAMLRVLQKAM